MGAAAAAVAVAAVLLAGFPLVTGSLTAPGSFTDLPEPWRDAARWIDRQDDTHRTLVLPGAAFAENRWGRPLDEPWGILVDGSWAVRDLIPLGGNGSTRLLDGLDRALAGGHLPEGFVASLQRAGIGHLVVRNDLDLPRTGGPAPTTVRRLLSDAPGLERVAAFGRVLEPAETGDDLRLAAAAIDLAPAGLRQVEIYRVPDPTARATSYPLADRAVVGGAAEALVALPEALTANRAVLVDDDGAGLPGGDALVVATDTARRRDVDFGDVRDNATYTLEADQPSPFTDGEVRDRWADDEPPARTVARLEGVRALTSDGGQGDVGPGRQPFAAFDGDRTTTWTPGPPAVGRWLQVDLDRARPVPTVRVQVPATEGERIRSIRVVTSGGERRGAIGADGTLEVATAPGDTTFVRIVVDAVTAGQVAVPLGISEVTLEGVTLTRPLVAVSAGPATAASLTRAAPDPQGLDAADEDASLDRLVDLAASRFWGFRGTASAVPGAALAAIVARATPAPAAGDLRATGTAPWAGRPARVPASAVDGDPDTAWVTGRSLTPPVLELAWDGPVTVERLRIAQLASGTDRVRTVRVDVGGTRTTQRVPASGVVTVPPTRAESLTLTFDPERAAVHRVGIAEVEVAALAGRHAPAPDRRAVVDVPCGEGPRLLVDGNPQATRARTTVGDLLDEAPVRWEACQSLALEERVHRITGSDGDDGDDGDGLLRIDHLWAATAEADADLMSYRRLDRRRRTVEVIGWGAEDRSVLVGGGAAAVLATTENRNDGWTASLDGRTLRPVQLDGWRQGWVVPSGAGGRVELRFTPARAHRAGVVLGVVGALALVAAALVGGRRRSVRTTTWTPPAEREWGDPVLIVLGVGLGLALGGPAVLVFGVLLVLPQRERRLPAVLAAALVGAGAVVLLAGPDAGVDEGSFSATAQVLGTVAWLALAASAVSPAWPVRAPGAGSTPSTRDPSGRPPPRTGSTPGETG